MDSLEKIISDMEECIKGREYNISNYPEENWSCTKSEIRIINHYLTRLKALWDLTDKQQQDEDNH
jgi:hypothetical protein